MATDARQGGSAAVEAVLATPLLVALLAFAVLCGRLGSATNEVRASASDAARAAAVAASPGAAATVARETATAVLDGRHLSCAAVAVAVDTSNWGPGGSVTVDITCTIDLGDLTGLGMPGTKTVHAQAVEVVDAYRSDTREGP